MNTQDTSCILTLCVEGVRGVLYHWHSWIKLFTHKICKYKATEISLHSIHFILSLPSPHSHPHPSWKLLINCFTFDMQILQVYLAPAHFAHSPTRGEVKSARNYHFKIHFFKKGNTFSRSCEIMMYVERFATQFTYRLYHIYCLFGLGKVSITKKEVNYRFPRKIGSFIKYTKYFEKTQAQIFSLHSKTLWQIQNHQKT